MVVGLDQGASVDQNVKVAAELCGDAPPVWLQSGESITPLLASALADVRRVEPGRQQRFNRAIELRASELRERVGHVVRVDLERLSLTTLMLTDLTTRPGGLRSSPQSLSERWPLMNRRLSLLTLPALLLAGAGTALAQGLPTSQPALIQIFREQVKLGRAADHARIEAGWPAAFAKAKSPNYYLAMTSLTGASEAWFIIPYASNAVAAAEMKLEESDTTLAAELQRLTRADAEVLTDAQSIQAVARPELSYGAFPNLAKQRFWEISIFRVRPGHEAEFDAAAKAYGASTGRTAPSSSYRVYEVTAGMPSPTYVVFASVESYGQFDEMMANGMKTMQNFTPEERTTLQKFSAEGLLNSETNRFQLNPVMSYVSPETRATDPTFWMPKRPARRP